MKLLFYQDPLFAPAIKVAAGTGDSLSFGEPEGSLIEPPSKRTTPPRAFKQSRKAKPTKLEAIRVTGRSTLEARPPDM